MTTIGVLGAGQLGRMLALAGVPLGVRFAFYDESPDAPAAHLAPLTTGRWDDARALEAFASGCDLVTYEFENVPVAAARALAAGRPVHPSPRALEVAQDRLSEKTLFRSLGIETAPFEPVDDRAGLDAAIARIGLPAVLKTRTHGYDGKGQRVLRSPADVAPAFEALAGRPLILEGFVPFRRELSILAVRGVSGATAYWPLAENVHREGILRLSIAPAAGATGAPGAAAVEVARRVLEALDYVGVLAIELFDLDGRLLANEMAPRVHNSGHGTIEGAVTSQFENHVRAILGWPLGRTDPLGVSAMINLIGAIPPVASLLAIDGAHVHLYGKAERPGRKVGHVTLVADGREALDRRIAALARVVEEPALSR